MEILSKLGFAALVMVIGLLIVFTGLVILIFCIKAMSALLKAFNPKKAPAPAPVPAPQPVAAEPEKEEPELNQDELVAVITAALMAYAKDSNKTLVVRSIRRSGAKAPVWANAGRADQLASRF